MKRVTIDDRRDERVIHDHDREQDQELLRCKVKIYKLSNMQRCPYIYEMKERLLGEQVPVEVLPKRIPEPPPMIMEQLHYPPKPISTVVKLNPDGYGSHTSPTHKRTDRTPLMPHNHEHEYFYSGVDRSLFPKNAKTSLFIIMSFVYAKLLIVVCIAYVISDVVTHNIPLWYYEGFFTYLYGVSILFLLYVFCFLLQESTCCNGEKKEKPPKVTKEKAAKEKEKKKEEKDKKKEEKDKKKDKKGDKEKEKDKDKDKDKKKDKKGEKREVYPRKMRDVVQARAVTPVHQSTYRRNSEGVVDAGLSGVPVPVAEIEAQSEPPVLPQETTNNSQPAQDVETGVKIIKRKRKTTQNDQSHGSFFLRIGAIAFGLGTMIYNGLEFGSFFEVPFTSPCYMILHGINPVLQMVFTFMQMYFIFMNSRLNIHRFKVIARFGLMHVAATNICVWIRTVVLEYLKEITIYHKRNNDTFPDVIRSHTLRNSNTILRTHLGVPDSMLTSTQSTPVSTASTTLGRFFTTITTAATTLPPLTTTTQTIPRRIFTTASTTPSMLMRSFRASPSPYYAAPTTTTFPPPTTTLPTTTTTKIWTTITTTLASTPLNNFFSFNKGFESFESNIANVVEEASNKGEEAVGGGINGSELLDNLWPQSWFFSFNNNTSEVNTSFVQASCERINIMGTIVQDSAPYLFPFIIEYSLIGAAVIYVLWKHIGRNPRYYNEEDLEHRLEVMLSRRAVAMAHAQNGKVDCVGASKGLFFGLLLLVGSLICLILFFVLIHHRDLGLLAMYLADVSHCILMALSIIAIIVGFIRVQSLKFKVEEQSDLNDILLRVSAFGLFLYATFSVIAGSLSRNAFTKEPNLLVMVTGILSVVQVVLQLLFIADVSRRRVHLPEHDRSKPGRQIVTFLLICNITMWIIYTFETQKVEANPIQLEFYGFLAWAIIQRLTLPLCIFHRFHSAVTLAEIWKTSYKAHLE